MMWPAAGRSAHDEATTSIRHSTHPRTAPLPSAARFRGVRWVEPKLVAEVELRGWTSDGLLRHASYKGLRDDKDPTEVVRESAPCGSATNLRSHSSRPAAVAYVGLTKQGLAKFYTDIADWVLPHGRPLSALIST